jgi:hypothetical protein
MKNDAMKRPEKLADSLERSLGMLEFTPRALLANTLRYRLHRWRNAYVLPNPIHAAQTHDFDYTYARVKPA